MHAGKRRFGDSSAEKVVGACGAPLAVGCALAVQAAEGGSMAFPPGDGRRRAGREWALGPDLSAGKQPAVTDHRYNWDHDCPM